MGKKPNKPLKFKNSDGIEYKVYIEKIHGNAHAEGLCYSPEDKNPRIIVDERLKTKRKLAVLVEELYHAENFEDSERKTRNFAKNVANLITVLFDIKDK